MKVVTKYYKYFYFVLKHKWYVMLECFKVGLYRRGIIHDWDKLLLPSRIVPYVNYFSNSQGFDVNIGRDRTGWYDPYNTDDAAYNFANMLHRRFSEHHWDYWCYPKHTGDPGDKLGAHDMSELALKEMLCDWRGAAKSAGRKPNEQEFYFEHRHQFWMSSETHRRLMRMVY